MLNLYSYIDGVMLGVMRGDREVGLYAAAYKVYEGFTYAPSVIAAVLMPRLSKLFVADPGAHHRLAIQGVGASFGLALVVGSAAYLVAEPFVVLLFGREFAAAAAPFRLLCLGLPFVFAIWVLHATAISVNKERLLLAAALTGLVINVAVNAAAIPRIGASGAAVATVVGELVSMAVLIGGLM